MHHLSNEFVIWVGFGITCLITCAAIIYGQIKIDQRRRK